MKQLLALFNNANDVMDTCRPRPKGSPENFSSVSPIFAVAG
ncbi:hypothetical protein [Bacterioplanes sanyensis]|nr:hypothetical protein [Bacterioplanes sanyensis]